MLLQTQYVLKWNNFEEGDKRAALQALHGSTLNGGGKMRQTKRGNKIITNLIWLVLDAPSSNTCGGSI